MTAWYDIYADVLDSVMTKIRTLDRWSTTNSFVGIKGSELGRPGLKLYLIPLPVNMDEYLLGGIFTAGVPFVVSIEWFDQTVSSEADYATEQKKPMEYIGEVMDALITSPRTFGTHGSNIHNINFIPIDEVGSEIVTFISSVSFVISIYEYQ